jgi:cell division protein FtsZ
MNRRELLKTLTVLGVAGLFPDNPYTSRPAARSVHFVGLGGGGCNALEHIHGKGVKARYTYITHPERPALPAGIRFISADPAQVNHLLQEPETFFSQSPAIENVFTEDATYILLAALGGDTGTTLVRELSRYLSKRGKSFMAICSTPFQFEGKRRIRLAEQAKGILEHSPNFRWFSLEAIRETHGNMLLSKAFALADEQFFIRYEALRNNGINRILGVGSKT